MPRNIVHELLVAADEARELNRRVSRFPLNNLVRIVVVLFSLRE